MKPLHPFTHYVPSVGNGRLNVSVGLWKQAITHDLFQHTPSLISVTRLTMSSRRRGLTPTPASSSPQTNKRRSPTPTPTSSLPKSPRTGRASAGLMNSSFGFALDTAHQGGSLYSYVSLATISG